jgi:hypothetical protein
MMMNWVSQDSTTYTDADQDHVDITEHLRHTDDDVQHNGHQLRETGGRQIVSQKDKGGVVIHIFSPASRKQIQDRFFQIIINQATCKPRGACGV